MKNQEIQIHTEDYFFSGVYPNKNTKIIVFTKYISSNLIGRLNEFCEGLHHNSCTEEIIVKSENVMDVLELVGMTTLWNIKQEK